MMRPIAPPSSDTQSVVRLTRLDDACRLLVCDQAARRCVPEHCWPSTTRATKSGAGDAGLLRVEF